MDQIFGYIERITFANPENGFTVARLKQPRKQELTTVVGAMPGLAPGESVRLLGEWKMNATHGLQFVVTECHIETPSDVVGIQKYLESGMVRGIGPIYAERIVKMFAEKTLEVIDHSPHCLLEVNGIGEKRVEKIRQCWQEQKAIRSVMLFLQKYGVSPAFAQKLYKLYGDQTVGRIQENPYTLAREIRGIGFKSADKIAEKLGFPKDAAQRIDSGIEYTLLELADEGHTCFPLDELCIKAQELLGVDVRGRIDALQQEERIVIEEETIWLKGLRLAEKGIARELKRLIKGKSRLRKVDTERAVEWAEKQLRIELAENQKKAVKSSLEEKFHIITGGPGTGKSTITKAILAITEKLSRQIILAAPTGRAAKRMSEITKRGASTIHSLLQFDFSKGGFKRNRENPLVCDLLVIDEASMIETSLMYSLLKAIPDHARVLLVGDVHQLPSVGPGAVLKDMIESGATPVTELTEIFRQAAGSRIITNAHKINAGEFPDLSIEKQADFFFVKGEEPERALEKIVELVSERLPKFYRLDPIEEIQVLAPMKRGLIGIENLNRVLQQKLNPREDAILHGGRRFGVSDKVMQIRNDYNKEVYNGDIGRIKKIDREEQEITVTFDGRPVVYPFFDLDELVLAYAASVHKYQGSECPCVVIPVHTTHFMMLHRNLLYTAVTRGKRLVVLVGTGKAIAIAVSRNDAIKRHTGLNKTLNKNFIFL
ncbi:MAG: ATP-dependent RecD-like DNA helicase [Chlamydiales bacterium]|nr:ATP-dependent RecD-like DNA helicase [Chlamydiales bacterium]